ncbi:MAG TPA: twin-arginine translocation signal domain-containing protein, partial [Alphaproteobacteria bacterium]|nr:twin-arginine translocation signal domain-containing protein [Alphaproteobacteria bacterium]
MRLTRRGFMKGAGAVAGTVAAGTLPSVSVATPPLAKPIPSSGELLPAVGLGSWITFNVGNDPVLRKQCTAVMRVFFERGGGMIDSSPMYGSSQEVIGDGWQKLGRPSGLFSTDKVWTSAGAHGPEQIAETEALWGVSRFDLMQVHNLVN